MVIHNSRAVSVRSQIFGFVRKLGPGIVTGASRNDPSSIATYSKVGAQTGFGLLWVPLFSFPLLAGIQDISARVGSVTGHGIAGNLRRYYSRRLLYTIVSLLLIANIITLAADIGAMGEALRLLIGGSALLYSALFAIGAIGLQICISYVRYASILKWLTLALLTYVATALVVRVPWNEVLQNTLIPFSSFEPHYLTALIAALGATINPYLFFWQASQEVEELDDASGEQPLKKDPDQAPHEIHRIKVDTYSGMALSNVIAFFIMLTTAVTLHARGINDTQSAVQAAQALRPVAGDLAFLLFSAGIIGTGLLAVPVLAGSAAYAVGESLDWPVSLDCKPTQARGFYSILVIAGLVGLALNLIKIDIIQALYWAAVINGIISLPAMIVLMRMTTNPRVMGQFTISKRLRIMGWIATGVMFIATIALFISWAL